MFPAKACLEHFAKRPGRWLLRLALILVVVAGTTGVADKAQAAKYASIVVDARTGQVLYARSADHLRYPASLTKMMTLYMTFEALEKGRLKFSDKITFSARAAAQPPSKLGLKKGERLKVEDAILALVTKSANDVAVALAERLAGSESKFARRMTLKAQQLGMTRTRFRNASGLPNGRQRSTARDMATLARALLRNFPHHYRYFARKRFHYKGRRYKNHNHLLGSFAGTDGIKTGYINASGYNLVASVSRDGHRLIGVVFGGKSSKSRDRHMRKLIDRSFARLVKYVKPAVPPLPDHKPGVLTAAIGGWKVQVGAFDTYDTAKARALRAAREVPAMLRAPLIAVEAVGPKSDRFYRAQLTPRDAKHAKLACEVLKQRRVDCFTIPPAKQPAVSDLSKG